MKLDLSLCFIYFSSVRSSGVFHVSTLLFKYLPKILQTLLENILLLNFTFDQVKVGRYLPLKKVKVAQSTEFAVTQAARRLLHNSKRVLMRMMTIIHPF